MHTPTPRPLLLTWACLLLAANPLPAQNAGPAADVAKPAADVARPIAVEALAQTAMKSIVVVQFAGRDGRDKGLGSGFVIDANGLVATNLHVIGEARPITVTTHDGTVHKVTAIHATERATDLAILKIDAKDLTPLKLGDSDKIRQGQPIVALGNPLGLKLSVVSGVVSGTRDIDGKPMIQLAVPIEEGNSGGPAIDRHGKVIGILTLKHRFTTNLGFAVPINALKPLIEKPNPVPISRWLTIGALDDADWRIHYGGRWRQRAGRIHVETPGSGFGGRSLCFSKHPSPNGTFEIQARVKLHDDDGAAGLIFCAQGNDQHYGFYPTSGQLRLTRFDGPTVTSWDIIKTVPAPDYRPGDWNTLKVRVTPDTITCFLNDKQVIQSTDTRYRTRTVGLAKFRHTRAEFRSFQVGTQLPPVGPTPKITRTITDLVKNLPAAGEFPSELLGQLVPLGEAGPQVLRNRARELQQQAARLKVLAQQVHQRRAVEAIEAALKLPDEKIDLIHTAMLIAWLDNDEVDVEAYDRQFDRMANKLKRSLLQDATLEQKSQALQTFFFTQQGFHGSRIDYYSRSNSYLNEVIDDREGLPISLAVVFMELGRRIGLDVQGVGLPGHFVVRIPAKTTPGQLIDVFDGGRSMPLNEAHQRILSSYTQAPTGEARDTVLAEFLAAAKRKDILVRMLGNLSGSARQRSDEPAIRRYADVILAVDPDNWTQRGIRIQLALRKGLYKQALADIDWLLEHQREVIDVQRLEGLRRQVQQAQASQP
jgi:serine protease Do